MLRTSPRCLQDALISTHRTGTRDSSGSVTHSTYRLSLRRRSGIPPGERYRNTAASSGTGQSSCMQNLKPTVPKITISSARPTGAPTSACAPSTLVPTSTTALPTTEIAVMGPEGAANIIHRRELMEGGVELPERRIPCTPEGQRRGIPQQVCHPVRCRAARICGRGYRSLRTYGQRLLPPSNRLSRSARPGQQRNTVTYPSKESEEMRILW